MIQISSLSIYGPLITKATNNLKWINKFFWFFYKSIDSSGDTRLILPPTIGLSWVRDLFSSDQLSINATSPLWRDILYARDLIYSLMLYIEKNNYCMVKLHNPYLVAKQLSLYQYIPFLGLIPFSKESSQRDLLDVKKLE